ncbi:leucine rich repeats and immunoglobulin like domains 2 [Phyllostomus discolor]|nr:leucine rich repeats and immunoglobulin like domains 2 [Phyllostomus discolor]
MVQMPRDTYLAHPSHGATALESLAVPADAELPAFRPGREKTETLQRQLWSVGDGLGLPRPAFPQQPVLESPQLHRNADPVERGTDCSASPAPCHSSHDRTVDFTRTRNVQDGSEGT